VAVICPKAGFKIEPEAIITTLKPRLAGFKVPRKIFTVDSLPRNTMGKVQKNVLREQFANAFDP
jgi:malonyl-CoA/methylmalonyl-CoA synthetase